MKDCSKMSKKEQVDLLFEQKFDEITEMVKIDSGAIRIRFKNVEECFFLDREHGQLNLTVVAH